MIFPMIVLRKNGIANVQHSSKPIILLGYNEDVKKTEKLVTIKNIKLPKIVMLIILNPFWFCFNKNPQQTIIIKLIYTARFMLYPSSKSEISIIDIGIKKESFLLVKKAPPNSATAPTAVK